MGNKKRRGRLFFCVASVLFQLQPRARFFVVVFFLFLLLSLWRKGRITFHTVWLLFFFVLCYSRLTSWWRLEDFFYFLIYLAHVFDFFPTSFWFLFLLPFSPDFSFPFLLWHCSRHWRGWLVLFLFSDFNWPFYSEFFFSLVAAPTGVSSATKTPLSNWEINCHRGQVRSKTRPRGRGLFRGAQKSVATPL